MADLTVSPAPGEVLGMVQADEPGEWWVITTDDQGFFVFPDSHELEGGTVLLFSGRPSVYAVMFKDQQGKKQTVNVDLRGTAPVPPTPPVPPDPPVVPDGLWRLTRTAYDQALNLPADQRENLSMVEGSYRTVASQISAGAIGSAEKAFSVLQESNRAILSDQDRIAWAPLSKALEAIMVTHRAEMVADVSVVSDAFVAIAKGLSLAQESK